MINLYLTFDLFRFQIIRTGLKASPASKNNDSIVIIVSIWFSAYVLKFSVITDGEEFSEVQVVCFYATPSKY